MTPGEINLRSSLSLPRSRSFSSQLPTIRSILEPQIPFILHLRPPNSHSSDSIGPTRPPMSTTATSSPSGKVVTPSRKHKLSSQDKKHSGEFQIQFHVGRTLRPPRETMTISQYSAPACANPTPLRLPTTGSIVHTEQRRWRTRTTTKSARVCPATLSRPRAVGLSKAHPPVDVQGSRLPTLVKRTTHMLVVAVRRVLKFNIVLLTRMQIARKNVLDVYPLLRTRLCRLAIY